MIMYARVLGFSPKIMTYNDACHILIHTTHISYFNSSTGGEYYRSQLIQSKQMHKLIAHGTRARLLSHYIVKMRRKISIFISSE